MPKRILILQGHPDASAPHFCHALADAYAGGAIEGGHEVRRISLAHLDFPVLRDPAEWRNGAVAPAIAKCQDDIRWAEHLVIVYPLWLGSMPALLKAFFEQVARPGFAVREGKGGAPEPLLKGKSARIVVTMGMPAFLYRWYYRAHSLRSLERNVLAVAGIRPVRESLVGPVEAMSDARRQDWRFKLRDLGRQAR